MFIRLRLVSSLVIGTVGLCLAVFSARVRAEPNAEYSNLLKDGVSEFAAGNWGEARVLFVKAHQIQPTARTFRGLGLCDFELRYYVRAIAEFEAALNDQRRPLTHELRGQVEQALQRSREYVARYELITPAGSELTVDGERQRLAKGEPLTLDPGKHTLSVQPASGEPIVHEVVAEVGSRSRLVFEAKSADELEPSAVATASADELPAPYLPPQGTAARPRLFTWVAAGLTGAFGVGIAVFGLSAAAKHASFEQQTARYNEQLAQGSSSPMPADAALVRSGKTFETLTNVSIVGCSVAGAATIALYILEGSAKTERAPVQAGIGFGGAYVHGRF
jgi:hypothetical protein